ncbi:cellulose synthase operon protein YhjQ/BcsQ, partial [Escherichia sp. TWPC-MK]
MGTTTITAALAWSLQ